MRIQHEGLGLSSPARSPAFQPRVRPDLPREQLLPMPAPSFTPCFPCHYFPCHSVPLFPWETSSDTIYYLLSTHDPRAKWFAPCNPDAFRGCCGPVSARARSPGSIVWLRKVIQEKRNSNVYLRRQVTVPVKGQIANIWGSLSQIMPPQRQGSGDNRKRMGVAGLQ